MYIAPETNIKLLHNVPIDNTYQNTLWFDSASDQSTYFSGLTKYNLTDYTYQRVNKGVARVGKKADLLYNCNYMMFQNTSFGTKWFYAFITKVEYVNNETSDVYFEIDVMQTWMFDYSLGRCYVEREHTLADSIGEHIEPEPVACGEYVFNDYGAITAMTDMYVIIAVTQVENSIVQGNLYDGIYGGATLYVYNSTDITSINAKLAEYVEAPDSVLSVYMCPKALIGEIPSTNILSYGQSGKITNVLLDAIDGTESLDGYVPKNKKLYTYPYNFYHVDNAAGNELSLRYEFFDNNQPVVRISGTVTQPVVAVLRPCSYKGVSGYSEISGYTTYNAESIQLNNYPVCSWNVDGYQAWVAQNSIPLVFNSAANIANGAIGAGLSTNPGAAMGMTIIGQVANVASQWYQASIASDISKGNFNNGGPNVANNKQQFYGGRCSVTAEYARMIDDFFTMFGYAVKRVKIPNTHNRPHWNYVKTAGCFVRGSVPADDISKICKIYDAGVTFWKNGDEVGHYFLDNSPETTTTTEA